MDINNADPRLMELVFMALDHGVDSIRSSGGPLVPFLMTETEDARNIHRFVTERLEDGPVEARNALWSAEERPQFAVVCYDGYLTAEGRRYDAVMAEAYDMNDPFCYLLAQRYKPKAFLSRFTTIGNAAFIGTQVNFSNENSHE